MAMAGSMLATTTTLPSHTLLSNSTTPRCSPSPALVGGSRSTRVEVKAKNERNESGRRAALLGLGTALITSIAASGNAKAGLVEDLLAKSAANKELNDRKRLATSGANIARAYTVQFGTCQFPYNFTGCQDLAKTKGVKFLTEDLKLECEGKDKYKCGSNVFWQGK